ncbi:Protein kinase family protein [Quillaja saponaria]|uniref:Protein kinase family protein n=1 Tax=Quillaja saponaria TaxID=32244 RepID=A0AAD7M933_QUISA|nr:Protein kinase family protein [Quillaja saponaria]
MATSLILFLLLVALPICLSQENARVDVVARSCRQTHAINSTMYTATYTKLSREMREDMSRNKFSFKEAGEPPDRLYLFSQCMDDLSEEDCSSCFDTIITRFLGCFPSTGGRVYSDGCFIRAENYSFFQDNIGPDDLKRCSDSIEKTTVYANMAINVINEMAMRAPDNEGFIVMEEKLPSGLAVYGLANCWKTLDREMCSSCLANAASSAISCLPSIEGRVLNAGCFLRYSDYEFSNGAETINTKDTVLAYISYITGAIAISSLAILIGYFVGKNAYRLISLPSKRKVLETNFSALNRSFPFMQFKYSTLEKATDHFKESCKLGQGGYGEVYKGTLPDGREIAIKRLFISGNGRADEVYNEMDIISRAQHKNLVRFLGCCFTTADSFLIYEFLVNRSLDCILFDPEKKQQLDWPKRREIIIGTAEGLEFLHKHSHVRIIHRDIKASNILLDLKHRPKIADFGLSRFYSCDKNPINTAIAGTLGYMAPEYLAEGRLTEKVDVYSFGVLVLETISGVQNNKFQPADTFETLVAHAWKHFQWNTVPEIIDESMEAKDIEEIIRIVQVGLLCTQESPSLRPSMTRVTKMLKQKDHELPEPSKPPFTDDCMEFSHSLSSSIQRQRF